MRAAAGEPAAGGPMAGRRRASPWRMLRAQTAVELRLTLRRGESVLVTLVVPALLLVFLGTVDLLPAGAMSPGRRLEGLLPGLIALGVMSAAMVNQGIATAFERQYGVLKRLGGSPLPRTALLGAKVLSVMAVEAGQVILLMGIALLLGWRPAIGPGGAALAGLAHLLGTAAFGGLGLWLGGSWRAEAALAGANGLYLLLLLLGGIVVPAGSLPSPLGTIASLLPSGALTAVLGAALAPATGGALWPALAVLGAWAVATPLLAAARFRWE